jgi:hypothetical protein
MWDFEPDLTGPLSGDDSLGSIGTPTQLPSSRWHPRQVLRSSEAGTAEQLKSSRNDISHFI